MVLRGAINNWPAMTKWQDLNYLRKVSKSCLAALLAVCTAACYSSHGTLPAVRTAARTTVCVYPTGAVAGRGQRIV